MSARWPAIDVVLNDVVGGPHQGGHRHDQRQSGAAGRASKRSARSDRQAALERIRPAPTLDALGDCDLVIEAATEKEEVKRKIFAALCPVLKPERHHRHQHLVDLDHPARRRRPTGPEKFIGIHFMNPVPVMELVEVIRGIATDDATFEAAKEFVAKLGKTDRGGGGFSRLHRQPHPAADDQRGDLHAL